MFVSFFFFFNDTATTEIYTLSLHDALPISSLARVKDDGHGNVVISFVADQAGGKVKLCEDMQDYAWVTFEESKKYDLIDGIVDELFMIEKYVKGERDVEWAKVT